MIKLSIVVNDGSRSVTLSGRTDGTYVDFLRRIGQTDESVIATRVPVVAGVATFTDSAPPEKTLLTYFAVDSEFERTTGAPCVVPSTWQLTRPALAGDIQLGDMVFNTIDDLGTVWTVSDIEGWWTVPEADVPIVNRSREEDGSYDDDGRYLARELTFSGVFLPRSGDMVELSRARLIEQLDAVRKTVTLRVNETPPRQMSVRLSGKTVINTVRQSGLTEFSFDLRAADPIKYSVTEMTQPGDAAAIARIGSGVPSGGRSYPRNYDIATDNLREYGIAGTVNQVQIFNEGNYVTPPVITFTGPVTNPRVELISWVGKSASEPTEEMNFLLALQAGEYLEIDVKEKTVLLNGAKGVSSRRGTMTFPSDWFYLRPGTNLLRYTAQSAPGNTTTMTVSALSAWLG